MLFAASRVSKHFGQIAALTDVSFSVRPGEVLGLLGPNGAGKTTLLECLAGVLPTDSGEVRVERGALDAHMRSALIFYVPDGIEPWPAQRVEWALDFASGFYQGRAESRDEIVRQLDLGRLLRQRIGTLSKGERKRVLIAIGLLTPAPALLIDEPFDGLDLRQAREIASVLRSHASSGRTLFVSIHQISDAARLCDRFVLLSGGRVRGEGTIADLATLAASRGTAESLGSLEEVFLALT